MKIATDINKAVGELNGNIELLDKSIDPLCAENRRLRAENMELRLKIDNLLYWLRTGKAMNCRCQIEEKPMDKTITQELI
jgi:regulator of replication initiation timing